MSRAISSNFLRSFTNIGWSGRKSCAASPSIIEPASRCRKRCCSACCAARQFNQGFATVEFTASALVDLDLHLQARAGRDRRRRLREAASSKSSACPPAIAMRHRTPHFQHSFAGSGYSAGYYSYLWSEILDADGFEAFEESGDIFDPALAAKLRDYVYAAGNRRTPEEAYAASAAARRRRSAVAQTQPCRSRVWIDVRPRGDQLDGAAMLTSTGSRRLDSGEHLLQRLDLRQVVDHDIGIGRVEGQKSW